MTIEFFFLIFSRIHLAIKTLRFSDMISSNVLSDRLEILFFTFKLVSSFPLCRRRESSKASDHYRWTFLSFVDRILHVLGGYQPERKAWWLSCKSIYGDELRNCGMAVLELIV